LYLFLAHIYTGHWIRLFQTQYLRARGLFGYNITDSYKRNIHKLLELSSLYGHLLLRGDEAIYYQVDLISTDVITTMSILPMELSSSTCYIQVMMPRQFHVAKTVSSSDVAISDVCIYSGTRFAPIYVPNYASSVCITIFFL